MADTTVYIYSSQKSAFRNSPVFSYQLFSQLVGRKMFRHLFESFDHAEPDAMVLEEEIPVRRVNIMLRNREDKKT
jgi:hypothetical protein